MKILYFAILLTFLINSSAVAGSDEINIPSANETSRRGALFNEVDFPSIEYFVPKEEKSVIAPYVRRYALACNINLNQLSQILGIESSPPAIEYSRIISPGRGYYYSSSTVHVYELLRARLKDRTDNVFIVLYNNEHFKGDPTDYSGGWHLAVLNDGYKLENDFDLSDIAPESWPNYWGINTKMEIERGVLNVDILSAAYAKHGPSPGGFTFRFVQKGRNLVLQGVVQVESIDDEDEKANKPGRSQ